MTEENNNLENNSSDNNASSDGSQDRGNENVPKGTYLKPHLILNGVVTSPVKFFRNMPKNGPLLEPLLFVVIMGALCFFVQIVMVSLGFLPKETPLAPFMILFPVIAVIQAGFYFLIWNLLGAKATYQISFRLICYLHAITPFTIILAPFPYVSAVVLSLWKVILLIIISIEVFKLSQKKVAIAFGILFIIVFYVQMSILELIKNSSDVDSQNGGAVITGSEGGDLVDENTSPSSPVDEHFGEEVMEDPFE